MRLQQNGLLERQDETASILSLLQIMARTPAGSWQACPAFGLRDLFEAGRQRADVARLATARINEVFADLGIDGFHVEDVVRELSAQRDIDTYAITLSRGGGDDLITTTVQYQ